eukprot:1722428-Rhodomonas_salina.1
MAQIMDPLYISITVLTRARGGARRSSRNSRSLFLARYLSGAYFLFGGVLLALSEACAHTAHTVHTLVSV